MTYKKYPGDEAVNAHIAQKEPLIAAISFDGETACLSLLDDSFEHHILLANSGVDQRDIDKFFRIVTDSETAEWTFVCPPDYKNIADRKRRITRFYCDGIGIISTLLAEIGYYSDITIPKRYRPLGVD